MTRPEPRTHGRVEVTDDDPIKMSDAFLGWPSESASSEDEEGEESFDSGDDALHGGHVVEVSIVLDALEELEDFDEAASEVRAG
jgi:hypothetical protein